MKNEVIVNFAKIEKSGLSLIQYLFLSQIHSLSAGTKSREMSGWTFAGTATYAEILGVTQRSIRNYKNELKNQGWLEIHKDTHMIRCTKKWIDLQSKDTKNAEKQEENTSTLEENISKDEENISDTTLLYIKNRNINKEANEVALYLQEKIKTWKKNIHVNLNAWEKDIALAIKEDERSKDELLKCIDYIYSPLTNFWRPYVLSGAKLREKFDLIEAQAMNPRLSKTQTQFIIADIVDQATDFTWEV